MKLLRKLGVPLIVVTVLIAGCGSSKSSSSNGNGPKSSSSNGKGTVVLGVMTPLTGPSAAFGNYTRNAMTALEKSINASGGLAGSQVKIIVVDDKGDPTESANQARKLIQQGAIALLGPGSTTGVLAVGPIALAAKIPLISGTLSAALADPKLAFHDDLWAVSPNDSLVLPAVFDRAVEKGGPRIAVVRSDDAYGQYGETVFEKEATTKNATIIVQVAVAPTATDLSAQAAKVIAAKPDAVVIQMTQPTQIASFLTQAGALGLTVPIVTGASGDTPAIAKAIADKSNLNYQSKSLFSDAKATPNQTKLLADIVASGNQPGRTTQDFVYANCVATVMAAIAKSGTATSDGIQKALQAGLTVDGYLAEPLQFSADKHLGASADAAIWQKAEGGKFVPAT